jgi:hypothetical protein
MIVELRQYTLHPGRRDELIELFEREFVEPQEAAGMELLGLFRDAGRADRFVWIRGFPDMEKRRVSLERFYGGPVWQAHRDAANATMIDSDNVLLLRPANGRTLAPAAVRAPLFCVTHIFTSRRELNDFAASFQASVAPTLARGGGEVLATYVTESSENTFPRLPVREGEFAFVTLTSGILGGTLDGTASDVVELLPTKRSRIQTRQ